jgi:DNA primase
MIPEKTVTEILETAKIEDVVGDFVTLKRRGVNMIGLCPFHNEKTPSFTVSPAKNIFKCFGCGQAGNTAKFIMEHESSTFPDALRYLANKYGIKIEEKKLTPEMRAAMQAEDSLFIVNDYALKYFQDTLFETDMGKSVGLNYFKERGYREETIRKWGLGFTDERKSDFTTKATADGHAIDKLKKLGLTSQYGNDFFRNRVMFTIRNLSGKVAAFAGRIMVKDVKAPKYINSPETEVYNKSKTLYGAYFAKKQIRKNDECILVEGYTDVISLHQAGIENGVASSGTSLTVEQIGVVKRFSKNMKILYDGDAAGVKAALRGLDMVLEQDMNVKVVLLPEGEDPDSYVNKVGTAKFQEYIDQEAKDFILFKTSLLLKEAAGDPIKKTELIKGIVGSIAKIPDPIKRSLYVKECAKVMEVDEQVLIVEANRTVGQLMKKRQLDRERKARQQARERQKGRGDNSGFGNDFPPPPPEFYPTEGGDHPMPHWDDLTPPAKKRKVESGDTFQEKDIVRILIEFGGKIYDEETKTTVAEYILTNIEDVLDEFDNAEYKSLAQTCMELVVAKKEFTTQYFIGHRDTDLSSLAVDLLHSPYEYSEGWEKHEIFLRSQKMPEDNFYKDADKSLKQFKRKKIEKTIAKNQARMKEEKDPKKLMRYMKVHSKLLAMRNELAAELGARVLDVPGFRK